MPPLGLNKVNLSELKQEIAKREKTMGDKSLAFPSISTTGNSFDIEKAAVVACEVEKQKEKRGFK